MRTYPYTPPSALAYLAVVLLLHYVFHFEAKTAGFVAIVVFPLGWIAKRVEAPIKRAPYRRRQERIVTKLEADGVIKATQAEQIRARLKER
jgi:hypothetical protein